MCFEPNEWLQANVAALQKTDSRAVKKNWHPTEDDLLNAGCVVVVRPGHGGNKTAYKGGAIVAAHDDYGRWRFKTTVGLDRKPRFRVKALSVKATS